MNEAEYYWQPILLGSILSGILLGAIGYVMTRILWRWYVIFRWRKRRKIRHNRQHF